MYYTFIFTFVFIELINYSPLYSMLCHIESILISGVPVIPSITLPCQDYVQTTYEIRFHDDIPPIFTKELLDLYAYGIASTAAAASGYNITVVPNTGKFSDNRYSMTISEPVTASIAETLCQTYQAETYKKGHYACYISAIYANKKGYCKKMNLCPNDEGTGNNNGGDNGKTESGCGNLVPIKWMYLISYMVIAFINVLMGVF